MKRLVWMVWLMASLAGCAGDQTYPYAASPYGQRPPVRYPLDYPLCYARDGGGTLYIPLRIRITGAGIPDPMQVMSLRKKNPTDDGCFTALRNRKPAKPAVEESDHDNVGYPAQAQSLDLTGRGYFSAVSYKYQLLNAGDLRKEAGREAEIARNQKINLARFGSTYGDIVLLDTTEIINGLAWRHRLTAGYSDVVDLSKISNGTLDGWTETFEHAIDSDHLLRQRGHYDVEVVADAEWIKARRAILRKMVEAIKIHPVTQAEIDAALADYRRQRAIDWKCGADEKCRAKEESMPATRTSPKS